MPSHLVLLLLWITQSGETELYEKSLLKHITTRYQEAGMHGRPTSNVHTAVEVRFGVGVIQIIDVDEYRQTLTANCILNMMWNDEMLPWNPEDFGHIQQIQIPVKHIWTPDLRLKDTREANAIVLHDGTVYYHPQTVLRSSCAIDLLLFPFDSQTCKLKFRSWTYDMSRLDVNFYEDLQKFDLKAYYASNEWRVMETWAVRNEAVYTCCPGYVYPDVTFFMRIKRQPAFYKVLLIVPCCLLTSLTLVAFWLPPESVAKVMLGVSIFVAFLILLLLLSYHFPASAHKLPWLALFYGVNMILVTISTYFSVFIVHLHFRSDRMAPPSPWFRNLMVQTIGNRFLHMGIVSLQEEQASQTEETKTSSGLSTLPRSSTFQLTSSTCGTFNREGREIELPEMRYNKFSMLDESNDFTDENGEITSSNNEQFVQAVSGRLESMQINNHETLAQGCRSRTSSKRRGVLPESLGGDDSPLLVGAAQGSVERCVREIKRSVAMYVERLRLNENRLSVVREWRNLALVFDRLFFLLYLATVLTFIAVVFAQFDWLEFDYDPALIQNYNVTGSSD